jgi:tRNA A58 N-methylase Trm61
MLEYIPQIFDTPKTIDKPSAWSTVAPIVRDIIQRFNINPQKALEFGVGNGYSISVLANYFYEVTGIDIDCKDIDFKLLNVDIWEMSYKFFIRKNKSWYDLIHIDMDHSYEQTFDAGKWAVKHSNCVLFHDTNMKGVMDAVLEIEKLGYKFYNYTDPCGLGILVK